MKHYDPEKVEALLDLYEGPIARELLASDALYVRKDLLEACAAVRASAREVAEVSEEEIEKLIALHAPDRALYESYGEEADLAEYVLPVVSAALARFGQQGAGAEAARRYSEGKISAGKFGELLGLEPGELHDFKTACGAFDEERHMELLGQPRGRVVEGWAVVSSDGVPRELTLFRDNAEAITRPNERAARCCVEILDAQGEEEGAK